MSKKVDGEVEFDFDAFFESIREYKEFIRRRYSESVEIDKRNISIDSIKS
jgi:hypothetical protein